MPAPCHCALSGQCLRSALVFITALQARVLCERVGDFPRRVGCGFDVQAPPAISNSTVSCC